MNPNENVVSDVALNSSLLTVDASIRAVTIVSIHRITRPIPPHRAGEARIRRSDGGDATGDVEDMIGEAALVGVKQFYHVVGRSDDRHDATAERIKNREVLRLLDEIVFHQAPLRRSCCHGTASWALKLDTRVAPTHMQQIALQLPLAMPVDPAG